MNTPNRTTQQTARIYIVMPVYNRKSLTRECLKSLHNQTTDQFEIVVVDDGSTDGTSAMIRGEFPTVQLITSNGNLWWTGAVNKAVEHVLSQCRADDYILLLNDDLIVPVNYIATFFELIDRMPNTLIGSVVSTINQPDLIYSGGIQINWLTAKMQNLNFGRPLSKFPKGFALTVSTLTGRGVLIPTAVFRLVGLHNQKNLPQHGDTEFPVRAKRAGFPLVVSYDAIVYSHVDNEKDFNTAKKYRLSDLKPYLLSKKSHCNLSDRFWFAYRTRLNFFQFTIFFLFDLARVLGNFIRKANFLQVNVGSNQKPEMTQLDM